MNRVYDSKARRYAEDNKTELNCTHGKSEAEVTNNKKTCARSIVLLKLTTDRHEVSRGLFTTAELFVSYPTCIRRPTQGHSSSFEMTPLSKACVRPYEYSIVSRTVSEIFNVK